VGPARLAGGRRNADRSRISSAEAGRPALGRADQAPPYPVVGLGPAQGLDHVSPTPCGDPGPRTDCSDPGRQGSRRSRREHGAVGSARAWPRWRPHDQHEGDAPRGRARDPRTRRRGDENCFMKVRGRTSPVTYIGAAFKQMKTCNLMCGRSMLRLRLRRSGTGGLGRRRRHRPSHLAAGAAAGRRCQVLRRGGRRGYLGLLWSSRRPKKPPTPLPT